MCGFFISNDPRVTKSDIDIIKETLRFRGPDCDSGIVEHKGWVAYHSRLAIIDIDTGSNQPVIDKRGGMLVFNGEILNFKELGLKYFDRNYKSDTLLLSDLLSEDKLILSELDGFFAIVYIDENGILKSAAKDKFGVKPLFVHQDSDYFSFSSEPNTLKRLFSLQTNDEAVEEYKVARAAIFSGSFFENVKSVEPGCCYVAGEYFSCIDFFEKGYKKASKEELYSAIKKGVDSRKISDAPVGLLLSKGIDSNLIHSLSEFDRYYTAGFDGDPDIEFLKNEEIKNLHVFECSKEEYASSLDYLLRLRGEPLSVPNEVLLYLVAKEAAKDGVKVLLSGEGADEFFGGYDRIFSWALSASEFDLDKFLELYCYTIPAKGTRIYDKFSGLFEAIETESVFEKVRWFFIRYHMPILFRRLDFSLMAAGIEGREPIANAHVFAVAIAIAPDELMGDVLGKIPLRNLVADYKGNDFAFEKKVGFPVDLTRVYPDKKGMSSYEIWFEKNIKVLS